MTPQERQLVQELFDRLAALEAEPRDPQAERLIADGLARAPHAIYPLVQTVLVQDEALRRAEKRLRALPGEEDAAEEEDSFLDSISDALFGRERQPRRGSVPLAGRGAPAQAAAPGQGSSFLGTAAATAAGVVGGALLLEGIRSLMGQGEAQARSSPSGNADQDAPWNRQAEDRLREAGLDDNEQAGGQRGAFDTAQHDMGDDFDIGDGDIG